MFVTIFYYNNYPSYQSPKSFRIVSACCIFSHCSWIGGVVYLVRMPHGCFRHVQPSGGPWADSGHARVFTSSSWLGNSSVLRLETWRCPRRGRRGPLCYLRSEHQKAEVHEMMDGHVIVIKAAPARASLIASAEFSKILL